MKMKKNEKNLEKIIEIIENVKKTIISKDIPSDDIETVEKAKIIKLLRKVIRLNNHSPNVYNNVGILLYILKCYKDAKEYYKKALELDPEMAEAYNNLGILSSELEQYGEAEEYYKKALELHPKLADAYFNLGLLYKKIGEIGLAKEEILMAREIYEREGKDKDVKMCNEIFKSLLS